MNKFEALGLSKKLADKLAENGLVDPTPIQDEAIPIVLSGRDVMGLAQTGTGKTAAFGLPIIHRLIKIGEKPAPKTVRALILAPTRELAKQICEALVMFQGGGHLKINMVVGGLSMHAQKKRLERGTDILVATPGRLIDLLEQKALTLSDAEYLVLDEADQMLDMGFIHALRQIAKLLPEKRQTLLFSATMPKLMEELAATYLDHPRKVQVSPPGKAADKITQSVHFIAKAEKPGLLIEYLDKHRDELALVFARTKHGAERLMKQLSNAGFAAGSIHGNKSQNQRDRALAAFKEGKLRILVATDVAARGIDIPDVAYVYNFDLPNVAENYVHRIGRTARAGKDGEAVAFCAPDEMGELRAIEKVMKISIQVAGGRPWSVEEEEPKPKRGGGGNRGGGGRRRFGGAPKAEGEKSGGQGQRRRRKPNNRGRGKGPKAA
ncbi:DEAD/DEAH box helicase [Litoreibacter roseus]|uniref:DEAD/DEAH box helicase n=1 Tax=Litoreibacter roseus TaxID=2601869 RepID=A0A6N6JBN7_9RHOB|nr:DEAD/DEAH box helicase [Litoreibacter roseus]GFE63691.1 DEAD/DEAH box helicase [Litoreibacter roseus]